MLGAIIGDISGSVFEWINCKTTKPDTVLLTEPDSRFTDDSVLSIATAEAILRRRDFGDSYKEWGRRYPDAGYGATFWRWLQSDTTKPYNSWGNGSAMRVSPVGWAFDTIEETLEHAKRSADATHNHTPKASRERNASQPQFFSLVMEKRSRKSKNISLRHFSTISIERRSRFGPITSLTSVAWGPFPKRSFVFCTAAITSTL